MKAKYLFWVLTLILNSCTSKENLQGTYTYNWFGADNHYDSPEIIRIDKDSIEFEYPYNSIKQKFYLNNKRGGFYIDKLDVKISNLDSGIAVGSQTTYLKFYDSMKIRKTKSPVEINLPKLDSSFFRTLDLDSYDGRMSIFHFGKRKDRDEYSLLLNDKYSRIENLPQFLVSSCGVQYETRHLFFCDKKSKMKDLENIFYQMQKINELRIDFINEVNLKNQNNILLYHYEVLEKSLPPLVYDEEYIENVLVPNFPPQFQSSHGIFEKPYQKEYFFLIDNVVYYNKEIISQKELHNISKQVFEQGKLIISLYDLNSNYEKFLEMNAIIHNSNTQLRKALALKKFNKPIENLESDNLNEIKRGLPLRHIWNYSLPHFKAIIKNKGNLGELELKPIDSLLPRTIHTQ